MKYQYKLSRIENYYGFTCELRIIEKRNDRFNVIEKTDFTLISHRIENY